MARADAVLPSAGFGDDAPLAHAPRQQALPQRIVDLVRAGMGEVFTLEVYLRAAQRFAETAGMRNRRRAARVGALQVTQIFVKLWISDGVGIGALQFVERRHDCLGHKAPAELAEIAARIGDIDAASTDVQVAHISRVSFSSNPKLPLAGEVTASQDKCFEHIVVDAWNKVAATDFDYVVAETNGASANPPHISGKQVDAIIEL